MIVDGEVDLLLAKWQSVVLHIQNIHDGDGFDPLYPKCAHAEDITSRPWIEIGKSDMIL